MNDAIDLIFAIDLELGFHIVRELRISDCLLKWCNYLDFDAFLDMLAWFSKLVALNDAPSLIFAIDL